MSLHEDIVIAYDSIVKSDAKILGNLLSNENFAVKLFDINSTSLQSIIYKDEDYKDSVIILMTSVHSNNGLVENDREQLERIYEHYINLVKSEAPPDFKPHANRKVAYFAYIEGNSDLKRIINSLIDEACLINKTYSEKDRLSDYTNTLSIYSNSSFASSYYDKWRDNIPRERLHLFSKLIPPQGWILDAGCGPGHHSVYLGNLGFNVVGIDLSKEALQIAETIKLTNTSFYHRNMMDTQLESEKFNGVWSCASLNHTPRRLLIDIFNEFNRVLVPGGVLAVTVAIGERQHFDGFGRFFESLPNKDFVVSLLDRSGFVAVYIKDELSWSSTENSFISVNWVTVCVRKKMI